MNAVAPNPRKELNNNNKQLPLRRVREIGGSMEKPLGEMDDFETAERPLKPFGMPSIGSIHFGMAPVEIGQKALNLSGKTTQAGLNMAEGLVVGLVDVIKMFAGDQSRPKTPEAKAEDQKKETAQIEYNFVRQKTTGIEQTTLNVAKSKDREALAAIMGQVNENDVKAKGHQETWRKHTAISIAKERNEKIAEQKRKRNSSGIGSPAKKGVSKGPARSTINTAMQEGNSAVGGSGGDNSA